MVYKRVFSRTNRSFDVFQCDHNHHCASILLNNGLDKPVIFLNKRKNIKYFSRINYSVVLIQLLFISLFYLFPILIYGQPTKLTSSFHDYSSNLRLIRNVQSLDQLNESNFTILGFRLEGDSKGIISNEK